MSEREEKRGGAVWAIMGVIACLVPVLYVLGIGPAAWFDSLLPPPNGSPMLRTIYAPLEYLGQNCEPIGDAIRWYGSFWT